MGGAGFLLSPGPWSLSLWQVANSWNPYWGEKGYFRIAYGEGGIDSQVIGSAADATYEKKH